MKASKEWLLVVAAVSLVIGLLSISGCKKTKTATADSVALCTHCGQIKGGELCCKPGLPKCSSCNLAKGSPGCCKIPKGAQTAAICTGCGQIKGTDLCCKPDQPKCAKCGLVKGSPGCCKLPGE
ncbi:MAG: hypothetical protein ACYS8I_06020 [Planctomycetota bacterium]|jgi:hypothetical protein